MSRTPERPAAGEREAVDRYVREFQRRYPAWRHARREDARMMKYDVAANFFREHILFGEKTHYDADLQMLLSGPERERLQTDREFTQAWRIFVDLCWMKKQLARAALIFGGIIIVMVVVLLFFLALPYVAGPQGR
jgi:hypothetical protein